MPYSRKNRVHSWVIFPASSYYLHPWCIFINTQTVKNSHSQTFAFSVLPITLFAALYTMIIQSKKFPTTETEREA